MAKKKNLKNIDEADIEFINEKLSGKNVSDFINPEEMVSATVLKSLSYKLDIKCKNNKQKDFLKALKDKNNQICFGIGSPGTGKSFLSLAYALKELKDGNFERIVLIIPTAQAGGADLSLGYLKGDFSEKVYRFTEADKETISKILKLSGNLDSKEIANSLINSGFIQYEYINFLLGKTLDNSLILVNEAEQYTKDNMRLILTRLGENSKIVITGDSRQVNRKSIKNKNDICGLTYASDVLKDLEEVSVSEFTDEDIVRNQLITKILKKWDN